MKTIMKLQALLLFSVFTVTLSAQNLNCFIRKSFPVSKLTTLSISNKYGDINVLATESDSLSICATVNIDQTDKILASKSLDMISIKIGQLLDTITVTTNYDKKFFSETYRAGRKSFSVDILIKMPVYTDIRIVNEFGNISVEELQGKASIRLSYGVLSAGKILRGNISPVNSIYIDNGKAAIRNVNWLSATLRNCSSVTIEKAQALSVKSEFSKIRIRAVNSLVAESKSDNYIIDTISNLISDSYYSSIESGIIGGIFSSKARFGSISISGLKSDFKKIDIMSTNTPVYIKTGNNVSFMSDLKAINGEIAFRYSNYPGIIRNEDYNSISYTGLAGENNLTNSSIKVHSTSGKITIE